MATTEVKHYLHTIERIVDDFVLEFDTIGLILIDNKGRTVIIRNVSDLFDSARLAKMIGENFPQTGQIEKYYGKDSFSWLICASEIENLLIHPVTAEVVLVMVLSSQKKLTFYQQQALDLSSRLRKNFAALYQSIKNKKS